jgi:hypothetical protein
VLNKAQLRGLDWTSDLKLRVAGRSECEAVKNFVLCSLATEEVTFKEF